MSFPGASYIAGMDELSKQHLSSVATVIAVLVFNMIMLILLELPLLAYAIKPEATEAGVQRFSNRLTRNDGRIALIGGAAFGIFLLARGAITLLK